MPVANNSCHPEPGLMSNRKRHVRGSGGVHLQKLRFDPGQRASKVINASPKASERSEARAPCCGMVSSGQVGSTLEATRRSEVRAPCCGMVDDMGDQGSDGAAHKVALGDSRPQIDILCLPPL